ncbi:MAG TPA: amino acid adenylation domain-containing protein, partial [Pyrinomonadaceae bacterium]
PALRFAGAELSYAELDSRASALASRLLALGLPPEPLVGVCLPRSPELVVALLAVLKAGGAYVPLDPDYPRPRLDFMLEDASPAALLTTAALASGLTPPARTRLLYVEGDGAAHNSVEPATPGVEVEPDSLAYVIYTSGSTGRPKGAMNTHRAIVNRLLWMQRAYGLAPEDRVMQKTPFSFDVSVWEFFWPLTAGACLVLAEPGGHRDPAYLAELAARERVTTMHFVPSMLEPFLAEPGARRCRGLRRVVCSGEALGAGLRDRFLERLPGVELHNLYGPTEAAVDVTHWDCVRGRREAVVPIGAPIANVAVYVLDARLEPAPEGVVGEVYIGGEAVGRGYLRRPGLTAERYAPDPHGASGGRLYRTGDLGRARGGGVVEYVGRGDAQVKVRGMRVELGEVEAALLGHSGVREAAAVAARGAGGQTRLVAFVVREAAAQQAGGAQPEEGTESAQRTEPAEGARLAQESAPAEDFGAEVRRWLRERAPDYLTPARVVELAAMPVTANGKLDRRALAALAEGAGEAAAAGGGGA